MKTIALLSLCFCVQAVAAIAPDSIAGKAYHETGLFIRRGMHSIVLFDSDGRYSYLKSLVSSSIAGPPGSLQTPPRDGTYTYVRTGETTARLTLEDPARTLQNGTGSTSSLTIDLRFIDPTVGNWTGPHGAGSFRLSDTAAARGLPIVNVSLRTSVGAGRTTIAGFIVPETRRQTDLLIRVVGPSLSQFDVTTPWADPSFSLSRGPSSSDAYANDWSTLPQNAAAIQKISAFVGAFPLVPGSKDAVAVVQLVPGPYTILCQPAANDPGGEVLIEVYTLP